MANSKENQKKVRKMEKEFSFNQTKIGWKDSMDVFVNSLSWIALMI